MLQDQKFLDVFKDLQDIEISTIANSGSDDYDSRQTAYVKFKALESVMTHIQAMASQKQINASRWKIL